MATEASALIGSGTVEFTKNILTIGESYLRKAIFR